MSSAKCPHGWSPSTSCDECNGEYINGLTRRIRELERDLTGCEGTIDTLKEAYTASEKRCAELEGALREIVAGTRDYNTLHYAKNALSQTSPKE